jgi:hypothetical protein
MSLPKLFAPYDTARVLCLIQVCKPWQSSQQDLEVASHVYQDKKGLPIKKHDKCSVGVAIAAADLTNFLTDMFQAFRSEKEENSLQVPLKKQPVSTRK